MTAEPSEGFGRGTVTTTLGVSEIRMKEAFDKCIIRADEALYRGKKSGRDQVVVAA